MKNEVINYRVYVGDYMILDTFTGLNNGIVSASLSLEVNQAGSFEFTLLSTHPQIGEMIPYKRYVAVEMTYRDDNSVVRDNYIPFLGRIISTETDMYGNMSVSCEGAIGFFNDTPVVNYDGLYKKTGDVINEGCLALQRNCEYSISYDAVNSDNLDIIFQPSYNPPEEEDEGQESTPQYEYTTAIDLINEKVINIFGGVLLLSYTVEGTGAESYSGRQYSISIGYRCQKYNYQYPYNHSTWPDYSPSFGVIEPSFGLYHNITDIRSTPIDLEVWGGILPVGKDGLLLGTSTHSPQLATKFWATNIHSKYGKILKTVDFSYADTDEYLTTLANEYLRWFDPSWDDMPGVPYVKYEVSGVESCEVFGNVEALTRLGWQVQLRPDVQESDVDPSTVDLGNELTVLCLSMKHNLFNITKSQYTFGPDVPESLINEDMSAYGF